MTEGRNTGFRKILNALERNGSPKPEFETDEEHSYFIARIFVREGFESEKLSDERNFVQQNERSLSEVLSEVLNKAEYEKVLPLIEYLETHVTITPKEVEELTGKSAATARRYLKILVESGVLSMSGSTNRIQYFRII